MAVLTISREFGAGGRTLGKLVAKQMNYTLVDEDIVQMVAERAKVSGNSVRNIEKEAGGSLLRFMNYLISERSVSRILDDNHGYIDEQIYIDTLHEIITELGNEGNCVIVGRGGQYILRDHPEAYHLLLVAERQDRIRFMMEHYKMNEERAESTIRVHGKRRRNLYKKFGKETYDQPGLYHLVINMSKLSMEKAVDFACHMLKS